MLYHKLHLKDPSARWHMKLLLENFYLFLYLLHSYSPFPRKEFRAAYIVPSLHLTSQQSYEVVPSNEMDLDEIFQWWNETSLILCSHCSSLISVKCCSCKRGDPGALHEGHLQQEGRFSRNWWFTLSSVCWHIFLHIAVPSIHQSVTVPASQSRAVDRFQGIAYSSKNVCLCFCHPSPSVSSCGF